MRESDYEQHRDLVRPGQADEPLVIELERIRKQIEEVSGLNPVLRGRGRDPLDPESMATQSGYPLNNLMQVWLMRRRDRFSGRPYDPTYPKYLRHPQAVRL